MRKRSFHISAHNTKGNSLVSPYEKVLDEHREESTTEVKPKKVAKRVDVTTIAKKRLEQFKIPNQKYYKIINIVSDPEFLVSCYEEIKSKPGNMTRGSDRRTLDGINYKWFVDSSKRINSGKYEFKPNRRVEIPKANGKTRTLGVGSPRDKIVQKALHAVLEAIFEPKFLNSSHGFRPKRSTHSALLSLYLNGHKHN